MDYSCYCLHHLASVMFNSDLKPRHKLKQSEGNGSTQQSNKGHKVRIMQYQAVRSHQRPLYLRGVRDLHHQQLCAEDIYRFKMSIPYPLHLRSDFKKDECKRKPCTHHFPTHDLEFSRISTENVRAHHAYAQFSTRGLLYAKYCKGLQYLISLTTWGQGKQNMSSPFKLIWRTCEKTVAYLHIQQLRSIIIYSESCFLPMNV